MAAKPLSDPAARLGLGTKDHTPLLPCSMSGSWLPVVGSMSQPTVQVEPSAEVVTLKRSFSPVPAFRGYLDGQGTWRTCCHISRVRRGVGLFLASESDRCGRRSDPERQC
jgi:hypothetical protein